MVVMSRFFSGKVLFLAGAVLEFLSMHLPVPLSFSILEMSFSCKGFWMSCVCQMIFSTPHSAVHIPGVSNDEAFTLSRDRMCAICRDDLCEV
jgi:hypothetical protein